MDMSEERKRVQDFVADLKEGLSEMAKATDFDRAVIRQAGIRKLSPMALFTAVSQLNAVVLDFTTYSMGNLIDETDHILGMENLMQVFEDQLVAAGFAMEEEPCKHCGYVHDKPAAPAPKEATTDPKPSDPSSN
jgi:hypothetical protein